MVHFYFHKTGIFRVSTSIKLLKFQILFPYLGSLRDSNAIVRSTKVSIEHKILRPASVYCLQGGVFVSALIKRLEVGVDRTPFRDCGNDAECYEFVAHLAEVFVRSIELSDFVSSTNGHLV